MEALQSALCLLPKNVPLIKGPLTLSAQFQYCDELPNSLNFSELNSSSRKIPVYGKHLGGKI